MSLTKSLSIFALILFGLYFIFTRVMGTDPAADYPGAAQPAMAEETIKRLGLANVRAIYTQQEQVEFQSLSPSWGKPAPALCGELRSKNETGSYGPFHRFVALIDQRSLVHVYGDITTPAMFARVWDGACGYPKPASSAR